MSEISHDDQVNPAWWIIPIAFVVLILGSFVLSLLGLAGDNDSALNLVSLSFGGGLLLGLANMVQALVLGLTRRPQCLPFVRRALLLIKLAFIPLFVLFGGLIAMLSIMLIHPVLASIPLITIPLLLVLGWLLLAVGSSWTFVYAIGLACERRISPGECVVHCILSLFFVADVVDAVVLFVRGRKRERFELQEPVR